MGDLEKAAFVTKWDWPKHLETRFHQLIAESGSEVEVLTFVRGYEIEIRLLYPRDASRHLEISLRELNLRRKWRMDIIP